MAHEIVIHPFNQSVTGWVAYVLLSVLLLGAWIKMAWLAVGLWRRSFVGAASQARPQRSRLRWKVPSLPELVAATGTAVALLAIGVTFVGLIVMTEVDSVVFDADTVLLHRRWPWQNQRIAYADIGFVELADKKTNWFGMEVPRRRWHKVVLIRAGGREYWIDPGSQGHDATLGAIYKKISERGRPLGSVPGFVEPSS